MLRRKIVMSMKMRLSILVFAFIIAIGHVSAAQYSGSCGIGLSWSLNTSDGVLQIKGWGTTMYTWNKASDVPWYTYRSYVKTIVIPNSLTSIGSYAFYGLSNIVSVEIPDNVSNIGDYAFWGCSKLESISISKNITTIGTNAFRGCAKLTLVTIDSNTLISALYYGGSGNCNAMFGDQVTQYILGPNVQSIGGWVFYRCKNLKSIIISDNIKTIEGYAFEESGLQSITIGSGLSRIDNYAFRACTQLTSLNINSNYVISSKSIKDVFGTQVTTCILGDSIRTIGESAFSGCVNMKSITIGSNVEEIKKDAFRNCSNLTDITIPQNVTTIGRTVFNGCSKLKSIVWNAKHVVTVWNSSSSAPFYGIRSQIESFTIGDSVEVVPYWICYEMNHITSITFPEKLNAIRDNAFVGCSGLTCPIVIPDNVTYLGQGAFDNCSNIPSATIGDGIINIYGFTFGDCTNLTSITIGKNVSHVELGAFYGCNRLNSIVWNAINCEDFSNNKTPFYSRGELAEDVLIALQIKSFTFGDEVQSIPAYLCYAMHCCEVTIPKSVIRIGTNALYRFNSNCSGHITNFLGIVQDLASDIGLTPPAYSIGDRIYVPCGSLEYYREKIPRRPEIIQNYPSQYSLNLIANHTQGAIASNAEPSICDSIIEITAIPNEGYHFTQWSDGNQDNPRIIYLKQDTTFTAQFAKNMYLVQFFGFNDVLLDSQSVEHGTSAVAPEVPQVEHYDFVGWDKEFANVTSNLDIFAIYQQNATDVEKVNSDSLPQKVVIDGHIYILRGDHIFDAQGKMVR